ncbi:MAG: class II fumarate hydratase [Spirochaetota bacterium]|jgi:fumarate hydratase class II|nr:class II fumarate hydratase [Spirochaetota bacterium]
MRIERDSLGEMQIPDDALYGAATARAIHNFQISNTPLCFAVIKSIARIKRAWAAIHVQFCAAGTQESIRFQAIAEAAAIVANGKYNDQFPVDVYQTGSGTSSNMNVNEVIARLAEAAAGLAVHPNDDVNRAQSSNDVFPSAIHLACLEALHGDLLPALRDLRESLNAKAQDFSDIVKTGRTHLQDAVPITLGQEFSGYAAQLARAEHTLLQASAGLCELPLGGTAVGTGMHAPAALVREVIAWLAQDYDLPLIEAPNHFEAQAARDALGIFSAALRGLGLALFKIANDIRWLASGPHCGLGEISLPATQPGSSIMPAKINPVQAEALMQVSARVLGNDSTIAFAVSAGNFELNTMMPLMGQCALESLSLLARGMESFNQNCVRGITANRERCREQALRSLSLVTAITPLVGYARAASLAKEAEQSGRSLRSLLENEAGVDPARLDAVLDIAAMTKRP